MNVIDIPSNLQYQIKKILGDGYDAYIEGLKLEADVYLKMNLSEDIVLQEDERLLAVSLFVEYRMFSKVGSDSVAVDKIRTLNSLLSRINEKSKDKKSEDRSTKKGLMIF
ncbi:MAG: hypothetical protein ACRC0G_16000 [Fusobacteriaceae bacterium]